MRGLPLSSDPIAWLKSGGRPERHTRYCGNEAAKRLIFMLREWAAILGVYKAVSSAMVKAVLVLVEARSTMENNAMRCVIESEQLLLLIGLSNMHGSQHAAL